MNHHQCLSWIREWWNVWNSVCYISCNIKHANNRQLNNNKKNTMAFTGFLLATSLLRDVFRSVLLSSLPWGQLNNIHFFKGPNQDYWPAGRLLSTRHSSHKSQGCLKSTVHTSFRIQNLTSKVVITKSFQVHIKLYCFKMFSNKH